MKRIIKKFRTIDIKVFIYKRTDVVEFNMPDFAYQIEKKREINKWRYTINDCNTLVHQSNLYDSIFLLKSINKKGPVIGNCFTNKHYRGQSIYPYVINTITNEALSKGQKEVFIVVNQNNISSIKGIEKVSFIKIAAVSAKRWLWFYKNKQVNYFSS